MKYLYIKYLTIIVGNCHKWQVIQQTAPQHERQMNKLQNVSTIIHGFISPATVQELSLFWFLSPNMQNVNTEHNRYQFTDAFQVLSVGEDECDNCAQEACDQLW